MNKVFFSVGTKNIYVRFLNVNMVYIHVHVFVLFFMNVIIDEEKLKSVMPVTTSDFWQIKILDYHSEINYLTLRKK